MKRTISHLLLWTFSLIAFSINFDCVTSLDCEASSETKYQIEIKDGVKYFGEGYVTYREGIPFIYLKGDSYEIGLQYGVLLKEKMRSFYVHMDNFENAKMAKLYQESPWYMYVLIKISAPFVVKKKLNSFKNRVPEDYLVQLRGMSEGSGVPLNQILKVTFIPDFVSCSSFIKNVEGRIIHGRNSDHGIEQFLNALAGSGHHGHYRDPQQGG